MKVIARIDNFKEMLDEALPHSDSYDADIPDECNEISTLKQINEYIDNILSIINLRVDEHPDLSDIHKRIVNKHLFNAIVRTILKSLCGLLGQLNEIGEVVSVTFIGTGGEYVIELEELDFGEEYE